MKPVVEWFSEHGLWLLYLGSAVVVSYLFGHYTNVILEERFGVYDKFWLSVWNLLGGSTGGYLIGYFAAKLWRWSRGG